MTIGGVLDGNIARIIVDKPAATTNRQRKKTVIKNRLKKYY